MNFDLTLVVYYRVLQYTIDYCGILQITAI